MMVKIICITSLLVIMPFFLSAEQDRIIMLWVDSEQGVFDVSSRDRVVNLLDHCKTAGINSVAVDVKNYAGLGFFKSSIVPHITVWDGKPYPADYDLLETMIEECRIRNIKVYAAINVFSEGLKKERIGPVFDHIDWESVVYDKIAYVKNPCNERQQILYFNNRTISDYLSIFDKRYGKILAAKDSPYNIVDGNTTSSQSIWVSSAADSHHFVELRFPKPMNFQSIRLFFVKGFIPAEYTLSILFNGKETKRIDVQDNILLTPEHVITEPLIIDKLRVDFTNCGFDSIIRLREVQVLSRPQGQPVNLSDDVVVSADSYMNRGNGVMVIVKNGRIADIVHEDSISSSSWIEIPSEAYVLIADGTSRAWAMKLKTSETLDLFSETSLVRESEYDKGMLVYVNPIHREVQQRTLAIIHELINKYNITGIVLDRVRYDNLNVDFSNTSRRAFEKWLGEALKRFPEDIYQLPDPLVGGNIIPGRFYKQWIEWRAHNIKNFISSIRETVSRSSKNVLLVDYVGGWYPDYWQVGVNWASPEYDPSNEYEWATLSYKTSGYAHLLDFLSPGLYYSHIAINDALADNLEEFYSIEGGIDMVKRITRGDTGIITGLYYPNLYEKQRFRAAVQMSLERTQGVMIFSHHSFAKDNSWHILQYAIAGNEDKVDSDE